MLDGELAVPCNLQSALAGLNSIQRGILVVMPEENYVDSLVPCNRSLWTLSGLEGSSNK